jgi:hypothetical protein
MAKGQTYTDYRGQTFPFDVVSDQYTGQVRISLHGFTQAIPREAWLDALAEKGMMDGLVRNFMDNLKQYEARKMSSMSSTLMAGPLGADYGVKPQSKPVTASSKPSLLLLCED